jgi:putative transposase
VASRQYTVRKLKIGRTEQMDALARAAGELYSQVVVWFWRTVRHKGLWLKARHMMRWLTSTLLHAHTSDAIVQAFFAALDSWRARRRDDPDAAPPHRRPRFYRVIWKCTAITVRDGLLRLSNGKGNAPLVVPWAFDAPVQVEMGWDGRQYALRAAYVVEPAEPSAEGSVAGIDLGEVHLAVAHDGQHTTIVNGAHVRSLRRYQNKTKGALSARIDTKQKGSRRRRQLVRSKRKQLRKLAHQLRDALHKQTSNLVSTLHARGVQTVVIGDIRDIRQHTAHGRHGNQRVHQMPSGLVRHMLTYKAQRLGMQVAVVGERYTTQTCPACGQRYKPTERLYRCRNPLCAFAFHRDGVGAINIRRTYSGSGLVVGAMASPTGVRYHAHLSRSSGCEPRERIPAL